MPFKATEHGDAVVFEITGKFLGSVDGPSFKKTLNGYKEAGVKIDLDEGWVHLRKSNTEPILRIYAEAKSTEAADALAFRFMKEMKDLAN